MKRILRLIAENLASLYFHVNVALMIPKIPGPGFETYERTGLSKSTNFLTQKMIFTHSPQFSSCVYVCDRICTDGSHEILSFPHPAVHTFPVTAVMD